VKPDEVGTHDACKRVFFHSVGKRRNISYEGKEYAGKKRWWHPVVLTQQMGQQHQLVSWIHIWCPVQQGQQAFLQIAG